MSFTLKIPTRKNLESFFLNLPIHLKGIDKYLNETMYPFTNYDMYILKMNDVIYLHELKFKKIVLTTFISVKVLST